MNKELYKLAAKACKDVYINNIDLGGTEFNMYIETYRNKPIMVLAVAGTNETRDWFGNFNLLSKHGIKKSAVNAVTDINKFIKSPIKSPLLVCGHSAGGAAAIAWKKLFGADWCIAFAPARCLRYWIDRNMENTTIFIDPDDPVFKAGFISFGHPICKWVEAKDNHLGFNVKDHFMDNWVEFVGKM